MTTVAGDCLYTEDHEWVKQSEGDRYLVGITEYAQQELGDVVFVDLPSLGSHVKKGDSLLSVESVKAVSDVYAPVTGTIVAVNDALSDSPELINSAPHGDGWMVVLAASEKEELSKLLNPSSYKAHIAAVSK